MDLLHHGIPLKDLTAFYLGPFDTVGVTCLKYSDRAHLALKHEEPVPFLTFDIELVHSVKLGEVVEDVDCC